MESSEAKPGKPRWTAGLGALLLLALCGWIDGRMGREWSNVVLYVIPIGLATWSAGRAWGVAMCIAASGLHLLARASDPLMPVSEWWNAGISFGIYLAFVLLLGQVQALDRDRSSLRLIRRMIVAPALAGLVMVAVGLFVQRQVLAYRQVKFTRQSAAAITVRSTEPASAARVSELLTQVVSRMRRVIGVSRPILLGSRDPNGPSCVNVLLAGDVTDVSPPLMADVDGGPGTRLATLYFYDRRRVTSPSTDFTWSQTRLRTFLENYAIANEPVLGSLRQLAADAAALAAAFGSWSAWQDGVTPLNYSFTADAPRLALTRLDQAIAGKDLPAAKRWSAELAATAFAMADLHRWLAFLVDNQLAALDFQRQSEPLFTWADGQLRDYNLGSSLAQFPAGALMLGGLANFYEVERQAEQIFATPQAIDELAIGLNEITVNVPPPLRMSLLQLAESLATGNQRNLAQAARTPYERSYLVNMLFRHNRAGTIGALAQSLRRFDRRKPDGSMAELMDVLAYRGHSFAGLEWPDRYQPQLMQVSQSLTGDDEQSLLAAAQWTSRFATLPQDYGLTMSLRESIQRRKLDCIRATDMVASLYRNAGGSRLGYAWWCGGTVSHSVPALIDASGQLALLADGFDPPQAPEAWPAAYFRGHAWPPGMQGNPPMYAAELYVRGLDSYVWAEGYVVRGPNAGMLSRAPVPYLGRQYEKAQRVFEGPFADQAVRP